MASTELLNVMLQQAGHERDLAQQELKRTRSQALAAQHQLQSLLDYQVAYRQRWGTILRQDNSQETILADYRSFMAQLQNRIRSQEEAIKEHTNNANAAREALRLQEKRLLAMRELLRSDLAIQNNEKLFQPIPHHTLDVDTGLQQFNGFIDTKYGVTEFEVSTFIADIDLPIMTSWQLINETASHRIVYELKPSGA
jgi:flagellar biosynthesis chaperone FliJ